MKQATLRNEHLIETVLFCRALRERGMSLTPFDAISAVSALDLIDIDDRTEAFLSLRSLLVSRVEDYPAFEELFGIFWSRLRGRLGVERPAEREAKQDIARRGRVLSSKRDQRNLGFLIEHWGREGSATAEPIELSAASDAESGAKDLSAFEREELEEISRLARRIVRRLARNPSRRWKTGRRGRRINLRGSFRRSVKTGGELVELSFRERRLKKTRLVVICDVSGSMDVYSRLLLQFVYGVQNSFGRVETFVFSTRLERITGHLKHRTYERALDRLSSEVRGWSGGTLIGPSIGAFNAGWPGLADKRTIVIILSDGWDTGEPEQLSRSLALLKNRAARVIWLNPLLGSPDYRPATRGMEAAIPHIDVFAPLHDVASLRALERHLIL
jgi:uncharacterized protein with von Willebrand factor type A (vWA) domain